MLLFRSVSKIFLRPLDRQIFTKHRSSFNYGDQGQSVKELTDREELVVSGGGPLERLAAQSWGLCRPKFVLPQNPLFGFFKSDFWPAD